MRLSPRPLLVLLGLLIVAALIYDAAIFYSRWSGNRQEAEKEARQERNELDAVVGGGLKILSFYAAPGVETTPASVTA
jgi:hypothetical protein